MSYYTNYCLEAVYPESTRPQLEAAFENLGYYNISYGLNAKWYGYQKDCLSISAKNPGVIFKISGKGEEHSDEWWEDYLDGQVVDSWNTENENSLPGLKAMITIIASHSRLTETELKEACLIK